MSEAAECPHPIQFRGFYPQAAVALGAELAPFFLETRLKASGVTSVTGPAIPTLHPLQTHD